MFDRLPIEILRKIITSNEPLSLINASSVCKSVRKLNLIHLLLPFAYEGYFTFCDINENYTSSSLESTRETIQRYSKSFITRQSNRYKISRLRMYLQDIICTIDMMIYNNDTSNDIFKYYQIFGKRNIPPCYRLRPIINSGIKTQQWILHREVFDKARRMIEPYTPSVEDIVNYSTDKKIQLSFYALAY